MSEVEHEQMGEPEDEPTTELEDEVEEAADAEPEPEPEPELEPEGALTPEEVEKRFKAFAKARTSYIGRVEGIFEEMMQGMVYCPLCSDEIMGYVNEAAAGRLDSEIVKRTMRYLGLAQAVEYDQHPSVRECDTCHGHGKVSTGSRVVGRETDTCPACRGYGFVPPPSGEGQVARLAPVPVEGVPTPLDDFGQDDRDSWGEPRILPDGRENPNFGKWPQYKVLVEPYGITAGLTVQDAAAGQ